MFMEPLDMPVYNNLIDLIWEHTPNTSYFIKSCARKLLRHMRQDELQLFWRKLGVDKIAGTGSAVEQILNVFNDPNFDDKKMTMELARIGIHSGIGTSSYDGEYGCC
jgi:hypothetical protein